MVGHGGNSAGSYLADPTSPIPSHCASVVVTSTVRVKSMVGSQSVHIDYSSYYFSSVLIYQLLTLKVLVVTIDAQWEGMGDVGSARYELALLPPCPTIRVFKLQ